jgi:hypothetical protein
MGWTGYVRWTSGYLYLKTEVARNTGVNIMHQSQIKMSWD